MRVTNINSSINHNALPDKLYRLWWEHTKCFSDTEVAYAPDGSNLQDPLFCILNNGSKEVYQDIVKRLVHNSDEMEMVGVEFKEVYIEYLHAYALDFQTAYFEKDEEIKSRFNSNGELNLEYRKAILNIILNIGIHKKSFLLFEDFTWSLFLNSKKSDWVIDYPAVHELGYAMGTYYRSWELVLKEFEAFSQLIDYSSKSVKNTSYSTSERADLKFPAYCEFGALIACGAIYLKKGIIYYEDKPLGNASEAQEYLNKNVLSNSVRTRQYIGATFFGNNTPSQNILENKKKIRTILSYCDANNIEVLDSFRNKLEEA